MLLARFKIITIFASNPARFKSLINPLIRLQVEFGDF